MVETAQTAQKPQCELCGSLIMSPFSKKLERVFKCKGCGLVFQYPQPSLGMLKGLYDEGYFLSDASKNKGYDNYLRDEPNIRRTFAKRIEYIHRFHPREGRLLDVGCASGFFLAVAHENSWESHGLELSEYAAEEGRKLGRDIVCGTLDDFEAPDGSYDVVTMWDVIEHMRRPRMDLEAANRLLKLGGSLALTTPAIDSLPAWLFREKWMGFKEDEHLYFFSKKTLTRLLEQCGFSLRLLKFEGKYISYDLFKRRVCCYSPRISAMLRRFHPPKSKSFDFYMNPFDIYLIIAQKVTSVGELEPEPDPWFEADSWQEGRPREKEKLAST